MGGTQQQMHNTVPQLSSCTCSNQLKASKHPSIGFVAHCYCAAVFLCVCSARHRSRYDVDSTVGPLGDVHALVFHHTDQDCKESLKLGL